MSVQKLVELERLRGEAQGLSASPEKVAILEQMVQIADALNDVELGYLCRNDLITAATFGGMTDRAVVAFSWCLAQSDRDPERFSEVLLLWKYKWVLGVAPDFYNISLEKIRGLQADFEHRLKRGGFGLRSYYKLRMGNARELGFFEEARQFEKLWKGCDRDAMVDCAACEQDELVENYVRAGDYKQAFRAARPILSGKLSCSGVPCQTYWKLILAALSIGDLNKASKYYSLGYPLAAGKPEFLHCVSWHLCYLTCAEDFPRGLRLIERNLPWGIVCPNPARRALFFSAAANFFDRLGTSRPQPRRVRLPESFPLYREDSRYSPLSLADWFRSQSQELAEAFDARNGNSYVSWELARDRMVSLGLPPPQYVAKSARKSSNGRSPARKGKLRRKRAKEMQS